MCWSLWCLEHAQHSDWPVPHPQDSFLPLRVRWVTNTVLDNCEHLLIAIYLSSVVLSSLCELVELIFTRVLWEANCYVPNYLLRKTSLSLRLFSSSFSFLFFFDYSYFYSSQRTPTSTVLWAEWTVGYEQYHWCIWVFIDVFLPIKYGAGIITWTISANQSYQSYEIGSIMYLIFLRQSLTV